MSSPIELSPLGAAQARLRLDGAAVTDSVPLRIEMPPCSTGSRPSASVSNCSITWKTKSPSSPGSWLGWQRKETALRDDETQALVLLILLTLISMRQGSTRVARRARRAGQSSRLRQAAPHGPAGREWARFHLARACGRLMDVLIDSGRASALVGTAMEFKPLVLAGDHLYLQKMLHLENQLVAVLRQRLAAAGSTWSDKPSMTPCVTCSIDRSCVQKGPSGSSDEQREAVRESLRTRHHDHLGRPRHGQDDDRAFDLAGALAAGRRRPRHRSPAPTGKAANRLRGRDPDRTGRDRRRRAPCRSPTSTRWPSRARCTGCLVTRPRPAAFIIMKTTGSPSESSSSMKRR